MEYFNVAAWREAARHDDWYARIQPEYQALLKRAEQQPNEAEAIKEAVRGFFEDRLEQNELALGGPDPALDAPRETLRQAVIHHSHRQPGYYTLARLNAVHLLNLYMPNSKGRPISSNHYRDGKMVFYGYHWWVEIDGTATRLLPDEAIGWQAGNWEVNCQSIGICINDDLTDKAPSSAALKAVRQILDDYRARLGSLEVIGHCEANPKTKCPGGTFIAGWKQALRPEDHASKPSLIV